MKISKYLALGLLALGVTPVFGQPIVVGHDNQNDILANVTNFTKFDLDFPGGQPAQLVTALEKATGQSLNVIILQSDAAVELPAFKLKNVSIPELFLALKVASTREEYVPMLNSQGFTSSKLSLDGYEFYTMDHNAGSNSIWYFHADKPVAPAPVTPSEIKQCRFFQLSAYLKSGLKVDDITTAIQTGWDMEGDTKSTRPQLSFHGDTKLLIAVGDPDKLAVIDRVLIGLEPLLKENNASPAPVAK